MLQRPCFATHFKRRVAAPPPATAAAPAPAAAGNSFELMVKWFSDILLMLPWPAPWAMHQLSAVNLGPKQIAKGLSPHTHTRSSFGSIINFNGPVHNNKISLNCRKAGKEPGPKRRKKSSLGKFSLAGKWRRVVTKNGLFRCVGVACVKFSPLPELIFDPGVWVCVAGRKPETIQLRCKMAAPNLHLCECGGPECDV